MQRLVSESKIISTVVLRSLRNIDRRRDFMSTQLIKYPVSRFGNRLVNIPIRMPLEFAESYDLNEMNRVINRGHVICFQLS